MKRVDNWQNGLNFKSYVYIYTLFNYIQDYIFGLEEWVWDFSAAYQCLSPHSAGEPTASGYVSQVALVAKFLLYLRLNTIRPSRRKIRKERKRGKPPTCVYCLFQVKSCILGKVRVSKCCRHVVVRLNKTFSTLHKILRFFTCKLHV